MLGLAVLGLIWTAYVQWRIFRAESVKEWTAADAAIVLGAALWNDWPSPGLQERLDGGVRLYKQGLVKAIIVSGGLDTNGATVSEAEGMKRYLLQQGIPEEAVVPEDQARNTLQNVAFSRRLMEERGWIRAIVVTHTYHGARALEMARAAGLADVQLYPVDSRVMNMYWHRARETLAYTKWTAQRLRLPADVRADRASMP